MAELIGTASTTKDGLLDTNVFISRLQYVQLSQDRIVKLAENLGNYGGITLIGVDVANAAQSYVVIVSIAGSVYYGGDKPLRLDLKLDGNKRIYASVSTGGDVRFLIIGGNTPVTTVNEFPSDAVNIPRLE